MSYTYDILTKIQTKDFFRTNFKIKICGLLGTSSVVEIYSACVAVSNFNYSGCGSYYVSVGDKFMKIGTDQTMSRVTSINH